MIKEFDELDVIGNIEDLTEEAKKELNNGKGEDSDE